MVCGDVCNYGCGFVGVGIEFWKCGCISGGGYLRWFIWVLSFGFWFRD